MSDSLDIEDIRSLLPHRYPMLLVDRVVEISPGERIVGVKNVTINEPFFDGHFPGLAVMPGVLIIEAMAQVAGIMMLAMREHRGKRAYIARIENVRFRRPIVPGDSLRMESKLIRARGNVCTVGIETRVDGVLTSECEMTFSMLERGNGVDIDAKLAHLQAAGQGGEDAGSGK